MFARLLFCLAFIFPIFVGASQDAKDNDMLLFCLEAQEEHFTSNGNEESNQEEGTERLACHDEGTIFTDRLRLEEETQESVV